MDDVKEVADPAYIEAYSKAVTLNTALNKLPNVNTLTIQDKEAVDSITKMYDEMDDYQKSFVAKENVDRINGYREKMEELVKLQEISDDNNSDNKNDDGNDDNKDSDEV